jgi:hypothetical protein
VALRALYLFWFLFFILRIIHQTEFDRKFEYQKTSQTSQTSQTSNPKFKIFQKKPGILNI